MYRADFLDLSVLPIDLSLTPKIYRVAKMHRCLKFQVSFRKRATNYRALLRKTTFNDKASYGSSPTCILGSPDRSLEWRGLRLLTWKLECNFGDSRENLFDMHGDYRENLVDILAVVIISSPISSVRGQRKSTLLGGNSCTRLYT